MARKSGWARGTGTLFDDKCDSAAPASDAATLAILKQEVAPCTRCGELAATRTQTVFGVGNPHAQLCFLGEAPGADEDRLGEPFVGRGGQLLNKIIEACRLKREDVYILNMLKCRPPGNRNPLPEELTNCRPFLERQLELIQPEYICCLGAVASQNLLGTTTPIGKLRGKLHAYRGANSRLYLPPGLPAPQSGGQEGLLGRHEVPDAAAGRRIVTSEGSATFHRYSGKSC